MKSRNIEVAAEQRTGGDSQANRLAIHTIREVKATIRTLKKLVQLVPASVNIGRGRADSRNSMETARCETTHVISFRILQCCSSHTAALESKHKHFCHEHHNSSISKYEHIHASTQALFRSRCFSAPH